MPNWCSNYITMKGDKEKIERIRQIIDISIQSEDSGLFITLVGLPEGMTPSQYQEGWWDANISHWGTKWDIDIEETDIKFKNSMIPKLELYFISAWSPVNKFLEKSKCNTKSFTIFFVSLFSFELKKSVDTYF